MKIALVGYGKMGQAIERQALKRGHSVVLRITSKNRDELTVAALQRADVVIEFTNPEAAFHNVSFCLNAGASVVCGSTGWNAQIPEVEAMANANNSGFLWASNFSVGVNVFFEINSLLAKLLAPHSEYRPTMQEIHHLQKKDAPSGTAISLAEQIIDSNSRYSSWHLGNKTIDDRLAIEALREENVPGTHEIRWESEVDEIAITHTAKNRDGFALGAVLAAEFLNGKQGIFRMKDVLGI
ncbi:MAG: 4-hydroxy-tetrahydrodipicolinate reductase [Bacteroidetes bacterium]|nr:4-hydroxy-tetrahydrodipicolinate reductase [Bacteroidota bacterium]